MSILLVYAVNHLFAIAECLAGKVHGIPQIVAAPVLPVLDDTVKWYLEFTVVVYNLKQFL